MPVRVLLVDDEPMFLDAVHALLEQDARISVVATAGTGDEAVERARECHPDVALVDLTMPGVDGFELTQTLRDVEPSLRVVAVSGLSTRSDEQRALAAGACRFLHKGGLHHEIAETILDVSDEACEAGA
ncbi:MAG TPA: response regulator transcription factor [Gaiellaceae bacterium]|nr:response regulator transcription factor [Gaiellaceae bacterium]